MIQLISSFNLIDRRRSSLWMELTNVTSSSTSQVTTNFSSWTNDRTREDLSTSFDYLRCLILNELIWPFRAHSDQSYPVLYLELSQSYLQLLTRNASVTWRSNQEYPRENSESDFTTELHFVNNLLKSDPQYRSESVFHHERHWTYYSDTSLNYFNETHRIWGGSCPDSLIILTLIHVFWTISSISISKAFSILSASKSYSWFQNYDTFSSDLW